jgi:hypothetical protein
MILNIFFLDYFDFAEFGYYMDDGIFVYTHSNFWSHLGSGFFFFFFFSLVFILL